MSVRRPQLHPWLDDRVLLIAYRWLSWGVVGSWLLVTQQIMGIQGLVLLIAGGLNLLLTIFARPYLSFVQRNPAWLAIDIIVMVVILIQSGGWQSPFLPYAYASLIAPGLLLRWGGGLMAGLTFVTMDQAALMMAGTPASERLSGNPIDLLLLGASIIAPPLIGSAIPALVERVRDLVARRTRQRPAELLRPEPLRPEPPRPEPPRSDLIRRESDRAKRPPTDLMLATQLTRTRTTEHGVEELRREMFVPLAAADAELSSALNELSVRFTHNTHIAARVTLLGRSQSVNRVHRELLIRLSQEALLNIRQHASARHVTITLRYDAFSVALLVQDDGVGLLDGTYERPGLHALRAMQYRLSEFGGRLDVFETEGGGVTVRATMPLE